MEHDLDRDGWYRGMGKARSESIAFQYRLIWQIALDDPTDDDRWIDYYAHQYHEAAAAGKEVPGSLLVGQLEFARWQLEDLLEEG